MIAATVTINGGEAEIETFLMSCRVIGREVENAFLGVVLGQLEHKGVNRVTGRYLPTAKNGLVCDFYAKHGFEPMTGVEQIVEGGEGETVWRFTLDGRELPHSKFLSVNLEI